MDFQNVLVLTDFSEGSDEALMVAVNFAEKFGSKLTVLHVIQDESNLSFVLSDKEYMALEDKIQKHTDKMFGVLTEKVPKLKDIPHEIKTSKGIPYICCLYEIEKGTYDAVFLGSHGRSDLKHIFVGSTAEKVLRRAPTSVFVVRRKAK